jgi:hypothetical protein
MLMATIFQSASPSSIEPSSLRSHLRTRPSREAAAVSSARDDDVAAAVTRHATATRSELGRNNFHVHLHLVAASLRALGLQAFVMVPLREPQERDLFLPPRRARTGKD